MHSLTGHPPHFLVIRRDNIGDLVCTTPLFQALRARFPDARISALVNSYNAEVLDNNPYVDDVYVYTKAKHRDKENIFQVYASRLRLITQLRRRRIDYAILCAAGFVSRAASFARLIKPRHVIGFTDIGHAPRFMDMGIPYTLPRPLHETEDVFRLLAPLGIQGSPPPLCVVPDADEVERAKAIASKSAGRAAMIVGIHISARLPSNRWPVSHFVSLMRRLHQGYGVAFALFWSPGDADNKHHPGDDNKAREICRVLPDIPVVPYPTHRLSQLIAGLSLCDTVICSDGGAMHVAAGLGKRIVCFFGETNADRWYPWGTDYVLLQPPNRHAEGITVEQAVTAYEQLQARPIRKQL